MDSHIFNPTSTYTSEELVNIVRRWSLDDHKNYVKEMNEYVDDAIGPITNLGFWDIMMMLRNARYEFVRDLYYHRIRSQGTGHFLRPRNNMVYERDVLFQ